MRKGHQHDRNVVRVLRALGKVNFSCFDSGLQLKELTADAKHRNRSPPGLYGHRGAGRKFTKLSDRIIGMFLSFGLSWLRC